MASSLRREDDQGDRFDGSDGSISELSEDSENGVPPKQNAAKQKIGGPVAEAVDNNDADEGNEEEDVVNETQEEEDGRLQQEDPKHPSHVPRANRYFLHDDREFGEPTEAEVEEDDSTNKGLLYTDKAPLYSTFEQPPPRPSLWNEADEDGEWKHDMYSQLVNEMKGMDLNGGKHKNRWTYNTNWGSGFHRPGSSNRWKYNNNKKDRFQSDNLIAEKNDVSKEMKKKTAAAPVNTKLKGSEVDTKVQFSKENDKSLAAGRRRRGEWGQYPPKPQHRGDTQGGLNFASKRQMGNENYFQRGFYYNRGGRYNNRSYRGIEFCTPQAAKN